jgi:ferredoxin
VTIRVDAPQWTRSGAFRAGATIHESVRALGYVIDFACGGNALCGTCCVLVTAGGAHLTPAGPEEIQRLAELDRQAPAESPIGGHWRLACQARRTAGGGDVAIRVEPDPA